MTWGYLLSISMDAQKFQGHIDMDDVYTKASFSEIVDINFQIVEVLERNDSCTLLGSSKVS